MQANITEQQYSDQLLSEPHFDEEATILSARPVVPLHEVQATERSSKRLTFGLALIAALMIGALGATLIYRQRGQMARTETAETSVSETSQNDNDGNEAAAGGSVSDADGGASETPASAVAVSVPKANDAASESRDSAVSRERKPTTTVVQSSAKSTAPRSTEAQPAETWRDEVNDPEAIRAQRRAERIEARRQRRQAEREAWGELRGRRVQQSDDLLRIREIFEGPRRPPRFQRWQ